ncbi:hypothetical protein L484_016081 [Morus notabilis]|uniref:Uncharacterized protein n=1 Tax=Morus notabilis TaxID=981085 RepID=W9S5M1_9ROSA|nr:hypothetical protein L484_016081 [Morus notabilis]
MSAPATSSTFNFDSPTRSEDLQQPLINVGAIFLDLECGKGATLGDPCPQVPVTPNPFGQLILVLHQLLTPRIALEATPSYSYSVTRGLRSPMHSDTFPVPREYGINAVVGWGRLDSGAPARSATIFAFSELKKLTEKLEGD